MPIPRKIKNNKIKNSEVKILNKIKKKLKEDIQHSIPSQETLKKINNLPPVQRKKYSKKLKNYSIR